MDTWVLLALALALSIFFLFFRKRSSSSITITRIIVYPIKSCAGISLPETHITDTGLFYDRTWVLIEHLDENRMVTAREDPRLLRIQPEIDLVSTDPPTSMTIAYDGSRFTLDLTAPLGKIFNIEVFEETAEVGDQGEAAAQWLQKVLGKNYRLCRIVTPRLNSDPVGTAAIGTPVTLPDHMQVMLASEASLQAVISATPQPKRSQLTMDVFRPNLTVSGPPAFSEDTWSEVFINGLKFLGVAPCSRCLMITIDPVSLKFDEKTEPLPTLRRIHGKDTIAYFGQWFVRTANGRIHVGDRIEVVKTKAFPN